MSALGTLLPAGAAAGAASYIVFRYFVDAPALRLALRRLLAHLIELRFYLDEPAALVGVERDLARQSVRLFRLTALPALAAGAELWLAVLMLGCVYARAPLTPGDAALVTAHWRADAAFPALATLAAPACIAVETEGVRAVASAETSWRIRPLRACEGELRVETGRATFVKSFSARAGLQRLSARRVRSPLAFLVAPCEAPLAGGEVEWIGVGYPPARISGLPWLVWFLGASLAGAALCAAWMPNKETA